MAGREAELQRGIAEYLGVASRHAAQVLCVCCCGSALVCQSAPRRPSCAVSGNAERAAPAQAPWCLVLDMGDEVEGNEDCITATPLPATALRLAIANFGAGRWPNERYGRDERDEGRALAEANAELPTRAHSLEFPGCGSVNRWCMHRMLWCTAIYCSRLQTSGFDSLFRVAARPTLSVFTENMLELLHWSKRVALTGRNIVATAN